MARNRQKRSDDRDRARNWRSRSTSAPPPGYHQRNSQRFDSWVPDHEGSYDDRDGRRNHNVTGRTDSYRPQVPQGNFTFRVDRPAGISNLPPPGPSFGGRSNQRDRRGPQRQGGKRWQRPPPPSARALISGATLNLPDEHLDDGEGGAKFRDLDDLTDESESEMDISDFSDGEKPAKKRARTDLGNAEAIPAPKWSNPDPYTALPCPDETTQKKRDVVKLIRRARVEAVPKPDAPTQAEDFLSFDLTEDEEDGQEKPSPRTSDLQLPPPQPSSSGASATTNKGQDTSIAPSEQLGPLGSRKRTAGDEIKPPDYGSMKKVTAKPGKGQVTSIWLPKENEPPCPWRIRDHTDTEDVTLRLHKEILDFYDFVSPKDFEQATRDYLIENLRSAMGRDGRDFAKALVKPFGSFMSGLYLPTADMDLVVLSQSFMSGGPATYLSAKSWLYKFQKFLVTQNVAESDSIVVIAHARIPLVKFVDKLTGLKVDVSFDNMSGVTAIDTFLSWKAQYPMMPILVTLIKQFLLMRGLNEPVSGGIGGFSVICLVVSMLQLMPQVQSRTLELGHNLGEALLEFFELYGKQFEYEKNAISLVPPVGYISKAKVVEFTYRSQDRLSIIDPHNAANDISGGSSNTKTILACFAEAYSALRAQMEAVAAHPQNVGILDVIFKGDYSSFQVQRDYLQHVHQQVVGPC